MRGPIWHCYRHPHQSMKILMGICILWNLQITGKYVFTLNHNIFPKCDHESARLRPQRSGVWLSED